MTPEAAKKEGFREEKGKGIITWRLTERDKWDENVRYVSNYGLLVWGVDFPSREKMRQRVKDSYKERFYETERKDRVRQYYDNGGRVDLGQLDDLSEGMIVIVNWHNPNGTLPFTIKNSNRTVLKNAIKKGWAFYSFKGATIAAEEENRIERIRDRRANHHEPMTEAQSKDLRGETYYVLGDRGQVVPTTTIDIRSIRDGRAFWNGKDAHKKTTEEGRSITQDLILFINEFEKKSGSKAKYLLLSGSQRNKLSGELHNKSLDFPNSIETPNRWQFMGIPIVLPHEICDARSLNQ